MPDKGQSWFSRFFFGEKAAYFNPPTGEVSSVVLGYPNWPIFDSYGAMYRRQPAVRTVVDFLSKNIAQLNPKIYARRDDQDRQEWNDHPLAELLRNPNPATTRTAHIRDTVADLKIYDVAYWRLLRERGLIRGFFRLPPSRVAVEFDQETLKTTFRFDGKELRRSDMVIFHGYHPDGGDQGVSPLETLRRVLSEEWAATTNREWYWRNAARQSGIIERGLDAPEWSNDARVRFREQWESTMAGGANAGRTAILEDGMKWNAAGFSPKDSEYIEGRKLTYTEVARVYAPSLAGLLGEPGATATDSFHRQLYQDVLAPDLRMLQDEIDNQLLGLDEFNLGPAYCEFNLADKLKGSFEERNRAMTTAVGVPYLTINEGRTADNRPRIDAPWADIPVQPLNVLYGGQPAVTIPTEVPQPGMAAALFEAKLCAFYDRQEQTICSLLGGLKNQGELTLLTVWNAKRWNRELVDILPGAVALNDANRDAAAKAYAVDGLDGVRSVFDHARATAADARPRQPALTA